MTTTPVSTRNNGRNRRLNQKNRNRSSRRKAEKIEQLLADRFRARWKAVEAAFADGIDVARTRASCFFGSRRLRTARHYYNPARATKFATSSDDEIANLCWAWFIPFQIYAYNETVFDGIDELGDQLESLVAEEYVAMTWGLFDNRAEYSDWDPSDPYSIEALGCYASPTLSPLHFECDAYESIALAETGNYLRICKSVPEPFHNVERIRAMDEIKEQFLKSASNEGADHVGTGASSRERRDLPTSATSISERTAYTWIRLLRNSLDQFDPKVSADCSCRPG
jgi:hypothetical protein